MDDTYQALVRSWCRSLRARNLAQKTQRTYQQSAEQLGEWLAERDVAVAEIRPGDIEGFIAHLLDTRSAATASVRFRALQQFFGWLEAEGELDPSPMARLRPPMVPEAPVPVLSEPQMKALLDTCAGRSFVDRRDNAILRLMLDTGLRLAELAGLRLADIDLDERPAVVFVQKAKGRRPRAVPIGARTEQALDRYVRARAKEKRAELPALWLGSNGRTGMTDNGIGQVVRKRGREAGIPDLHPHALRHTWAHHARVSGLDDDSMLQLGGWKSRQMLTRYGASAASERARAARGRAQLPTDRL